MVGFTVVDRSLALLLALLFRMFPSPAFLVLLLVLFTELLLSVVDLPVVALLFVVLSTLLLVADLAVVAFLFVVLSLDTSGR